MYMIINCLNSMRGTGDKGWGNIDSFWNWEKELVEPIATKLCEKLQLDNIVGFEQYSLLVKSIGKVLEYEIPTINLWYMRVETDEEVADLIADMIIGRYLE